MYIKDCFLPKETAEAHALIRENPFGILLGVAPDGEIVVSHLPFLCDFDETGALIRLWAHVARNNPHAQILEHGARATVIFRGPDGYISSSWYVERDSAPSWNYAAVHCTGTVTTHTDDKTAIAHLGRLVRTFEAQSSGDEDEAKRWRMAELGPGGIERRLPKILVFDIAVERLEAKFKMHQDEAPANTRRAVLELETRGRQDLADAMRYYNDL